MFVLLIGELMKKFAVRVWQKFIIIESETYDMILDPLLFFRLVRSLNLLEEISEFIISDDMSIVSLRILNAV